MGEDITVARRGTCLFRVEARDHDHYWITCLVDYTGVEFLTQVDLFGLGEVFHLNMRGVLKYRLEVIWVGHVD